MKGKYLKLLTPLILGMVLFPSCENECRDINKYEFSIPLTITPAKLNYKVGDTIMLHLNFKPTEMLDELSTQSFNLSSLPVTFQLLCYNIQNEDSLKHWPNSMNLKLTGTQYSKFKQFTPGAGRIGGSWWTINNLIPNSTGFNDVILKIVSHDTGKFLLLLTSESRDTESRTFPGKCKGAGYQVRIHSDLGWSEQARNDFINKYTKSYESYLALKGNAKFYEFNYCFEVSK